ncbi:MAG: pyruvate kinase [Rhodobacteraceae bacterium]|nr:pyruvate kinase [Paracoccaceae bacterium]
MTLRSDPPLDPLRADARALRRAVVAAGDATFAAWRPGIARDDFLPGARNLADYLAFRQQDLTTLQNRLTVLGLSSLGRAESRIRPTLDALIAGLDRLVGAPASWPQESAFFQGLTTIAREQTLFFGPHDTAQATRIMVTLPTEAADDPAMIPALIEAGATCLRINCAHDDASVWARMIARIRAAETGRQRRIPVIMDLGGPKIRIVALRAPHGRLKRGDRLRIVQNKAALAGATPAIALSVPDLLARLKPGDPVLIDDGKIGARVLSVDSVGVLLEVHTAREKGEKLKLEKGVNFPSVEINLPALTAKDRADLAFVAGHADAIGYSFVQRPEDVDQLLAALAPLRRGLPPLPLMLKIETRLAVRNLPGLLIAAGGRTPVSVMIARGDLAMEVGPERLSEVQEEILWLCEAAHVPAVWATQVLESLVKNGAPSRAEITDAAMGQRAECVMLNKGPFVAEGVAFLAGILRRMDRHQYKKSARLSALTSWRDVLVS